MREAYLRPIASVMKRSGGTCPYCGKTLKTRGALIVHRTYCRKNPRR